jgi:hypothetical protein
VKNSQKQGYFCVLLKSVFSDYNESLKCIGDDLCTEEISERKVLFSDKSIGSGKDWIDEKYLLILIFGRKTS